jgi:hypothetical protein
LVDLTSELSKKYDMKIDTSFVMGERNKNKAYESNTDEKLALWLLSMSLIGKNPCLVTGDSDITRLMLNLPGILFDEDLGNSRFFQERLEKNGFRVYTRQYGKADGENYKISVSEKHMTYGNLFGVKPNFGDRKEEAQLTLNTIKDLLVV